MGKYSQEGFFFLLTYVEPKHQSNSHNQAGANDFQCLIWIFWVCRLSPTLYNIDRSQCLNLIAINSTGLPNCGASSSERFAAQNFANHFWHVRVSHSTFSTHCTNLFLRFSCVFTFLEIIKHNMPKMLFFSSIFNIKMATEKFTNFDKSFFKCTLIWQLSHTI